MVVLGLLASATLGSAATTGNSKQNKSAGHAPREGSLTMRQALVLERNLRADLAVSSRQEFRSNESLQQTGPTATPTGTSTSSPTATPTSTGTSQFPDPLQILSNME